MTSKVEYNNQPAIEIATESFRLVAPLSFGPRIMHFGPAGGPNLLIELENEEGSGAAGNFLIRGGHRLWHAPEDLERTYQPDDDPLEFEELAGGKGFVLRQDVETKTGIRKTMRVEMDGADSVVVEHVLCNEGLWAVKCAPWALTMFRPGGRAVIPLLPKGEHPRDLLPEFALVPWPYTDLSSASWSFAPSFIGLDTALVKSPQKIGITGYQGWLGYWMDGVAFAKEAKYYPGQTYPDLGSAAEVFCNGELIELETLGAIGEIQPGASVTHRERWGIIPGLPEPVDEKAVTDHWAPAIARWRKDHAI